jgi:hypothetical protein
MNGMLQCNGQHIVLVCRNLSIGILTQRLTILTYFHGVIMDIIVKLLLTMSLSFSVHHSQPHHLVQYASQAIK